MAPQCPVGRLVLDHREKYYKVRYFRDLGAVRKIERNLSVPCLGLTPLLLVKRSPSPSRTKGSSNATDASDAGRTHDLAVEFGGAPGRDQPRAFFSSKPLSSALWCRKSVWEHFKHRPQCIWIAEEKDTETRFSPAGLVCPGDRGVPVHLS